MKSTCNLLTTSVVLFSLSIFMIPQLFAQGPPCNGTIQNPQWFSGANKIFSSCELVKVGVGTDSPKRNLHLKGTTCSDCPITEDPSDPVFTTYFRIEDERQTETGSFVSETKWDIGASADKDRFFVAKPGTPPGGFFAISGDGSVGVGSIGSVNNEALFHIKNGTSSGYSEFDAAFLIENKDRKLLQLDNDGLLRAREIKVDVLAWPDYVFEEEYPLMPLNKVKLFIKENGHLPNVPSASDIETEGVNLGDATKITMEKVEELTLYMIEQQEQLDQQKELLKQQQELIQAQQELVEKQQQEIDALEEK
ncbi:MAG: hypothetical protein WED10_12705 [Brumimicrobium sp.]